MDKITKIASNEVIASWKRGEIPASMGEAEKWIASLIKRIDEDERKWLTEKPTQPGWYWYRAYPVDKAYCIEVAIGDQDDGALILRDDFSDYESRYIRDINGQWAGPIEPPEG